MDIPDIEKPKVLPPDVEEQLAKAQRNEITEHFIFEVLSKSVKEPDNKRVLKQIAEDELQHHNVCLNFTCQDVRPNRLKVWMYYVMSRLLGVTFSLKFMERMEEHEYLAYSRLSDSMPETIAIARDEIRHEKQLLDMIDDERLNYSSDIVRGMNVAIVEITGALAGLTFAFQNKELVVETVVIIGIVMSLSVMSTEYLAAKADLHIASPLKSLLYAGVANLLTIFVLLLPYVFVQNIYVALGVTLAAATLVIYLFAFYISVVRGISIKKRFLEMALISLGIAGLAFGIGLLARLVLHIKVI